MAWGFVTRASDRWQRVPARYRTILVALGCAAFVAFAWYQATRQARGQTPIIFPDSIVYLETAKLPFAGDQLFYPKPLAVPTIYRWLGADGATIASFQLHFAIVAWSLLGIVLLVAVRRPLARIAALGITLAFLLAPYRIGWTSAVLSEAIADSLFAIMLAGGVALALAAQRLRDRARLFACWALAIATSLTTIAWILTRDTNAITTLTAVAVSVALWRLHRKVRTAMWAACLVLSVAAASAVALWSTGVNPEPTDAVAVLRYSPPEMLARGALPVANNIILRILPDPEAIEFFADRGLPDVDGLRKVAETWLIGEQPLFTDPGFAPVRRWMVDHGKSTYALWLLQHPLARANEVASKLWDVLSPSLVMYMPIGWASSHGFPWWIVRGVTSSEGVLILLMLAAPLLMRRPRGHLLTSIAAILIVSGVVGAAAAFYGDAIEIPRHCYGAGQQIVLGLFLAPLAWLDRERGQ